MTASPLVIGATGGSGTPVVVRIVQRAGYDLGTYLNDANNGRGRNRALQILLSLAL